MHAQDGSVRVGPDEKPCRYQHTVVLDLGIDMLDTIDRLDDRLQRFRYQFDRIIRIEAVGFHMNIDHRHGDLRFFFTWQGDKSNQSEGKGSHQEQRGER